MHEIIVVVEPLGYLAALVVGCTIIGLVMTWGTFVVFEKTATRAEW